MEDLRFSGWIRRCFPGAVSLMFFGLMACSSPDAGLEPESPEGPGDATSKETVVSALGRLEPLGEVISVGVALGHRLDRLEVEEGDRVEQDQVLAYLDGYAERRADEAYSASRLQEAANRLEAETRHGEALVREAEARIRQLELEQLQPLEITAQEAEVRMIEAELATSKSDLKRLQFLIESEVVSERDLEHGSLLVSQNQARLDHAQAQLSKLVTARKVDLDLAREQLDTARANLLRNQILIQLDSLRASLSQARTRLERTIIRSPVKGTILRLISHPGESLDDQPILELGNTGEMLAIAEVYETAISQVRLGQRARITSPALASELAGEVFHIGATIHKNDVLNIDPTADTDARVVEVKIRLDESTAAAALVNLQVDVQIITQELPNR